MPRRIHAVVLLLLLATGCSSGPDYSSLTPPKDAWFEQEVTTQTTPVLVDFGASWCGPCKMIKPFLEQMKTEHPGKIKVVEIDAEARADLAEHYQVRSYPTLFMMQDGKIVDVCRGAPPSYAALMDWAGKHIK
jgi:thioredoxin